MKKHQLLEKAMRDYPAGTKYHWPTDTHPIVYVSSGIFYVNHLGEVTEVNDGFAVVFNGEESWAEIIHASEPLKLEKIAVKVNYEREFKLLMKHYDELGWKALDGQAVKQLTELNTSVFCLPWAYHDAFYGLISDNEEKEYKIIDFDFFCAQKGITIPKPILTSVDGVEMFEGDDYYEASYYDGGKVWQYVHGPSHKIKSGHRVVEFTEFNKAFASKEAAESWISEQNKPKEIDLSIDAKNFFTVTKYGIKISLLDKRVLSINPSIIEEILKAYKSLQ